MWEGYLAKQQKIDFANASSLSAMSADAVS